MAEIVRRKSWGGVLPLGRHASIRGSSFIQCASVSIALSSVQEGQTARHHKQFKLEQALVSRKAKFVGFQSNRCFASYLRWQLVQVREYTSVIPGAGETLGEHLAGISNLDCITLFALGPRNSQLARIVEHAAKVGAKTLYITDQTFPADPIPVTWLIRCDTQAPGPLDNHVAVLALCHLLAARVLELTGPVGRRRLTAIEAAHEALKEL